ncbi:MAG: hypothetical protein H7Z41_11450 [Cytophagales bacterium]|nr:hypothetical protein [Armatimonadota bacterium]
MIPFTLVLPFILELIVAGCACVAVALAVKQAPRFLPWLITFAAGHCTTALAVLMGILNFRRLMNGGSNYGDPSQQGFLIVQQGFSFLGYLLMITSMALLLVSLSSERRASLPPPPR